jgi:hypothetical protein
MIIVRLFLATMSAVIELEINYRSKPFSIILTHHLAKSDL